MPAAISISIHPAATPRATMAARKPSQTQLLLSDTFRPRTEHGSSIRKGRRKLERPLDPRKSLHVVYRSSQATGRLSLLQTKNAARISQKVHQLARKFRIRIYQYANSGNHLHLLIRGKSRKDIQDFLRAVGARVAQLVTCAKKGKPFGKFWDQLAYTRVVNWGKAFVEAKYYVLRNELEAQGVMDYAWRGLRKGTRAWVKARRARP